MFLEGNLTQMMEEVYGKLAMNRSAKERFSSGFWSQITPYRQGSIKKTTTTSFGLEAEWNAMTQLWEAGFRAMPKPLSLEDRGDSILMEEVYHGIQLGELLELAEQKEVPKSLAQHNLDVVQDTVESLWAFGFTHGDLHEANILIGLDSKGRWRAWLIDFSKTEESTDQERDRASLRAAVGKYGFDIF